MMSDRDLEFVRSVVDKKVRLRLLRDDLVDHLCCSIEESMKSGIDFESALEASLRALAPQGLESIQRDSVRLLNSSNIMHMKKVMYVLGLLGAIGISMGLMFKLLHLPGGGQIFNIGFMFFVFGYLPMKAYHHFTRDEYASLLKKMMVASLGVSATLVAGAIYCKLIMHIPLATVLLMSGVSLFSFAFLPLLFLDMYKRSVAEG